MDFPRVRLLAAMIVLDRLTTPSPMRPPPLVWAVFPVIVELMIVALDLGVTNTPPPVVPERLSAIVLLAIVSVTAPVAPAPGEEYTPPPMVASFSETVESSSVSDAGVDDFSGVMLAMPPAGAMLPVIVIRVEREGSLVGHGRPLRARRSRR